MHGAFVDASSWKGVIKILQKDGYPSLPPPMPLRSVKSDVDSMAACCPASKPQSSWSASYGGTVISNAAGGHENVKALVYVSAFAPEAGETIARLAGKFPGSTLGLGPTPVSPVALSGGGLALYIQQDKFRDLFAADVAEVGAKLAAATQRVLNHAWPASWS